MVQLLGAGHLSEKIRSWVAETTGWFSYEDCDKEIGIRESSDKDVRRHVFMKLKADGKIESHHKDNKLYRFVNTSVRLIDFKSVTNTKPLDIKYPFGIENYFNTMLTSGRLVEDKTMEHPATTLGAPL